jgi:hypothetical protein
MKVSFRGATQSALAVLVRLGFYGSLTTGVALFDAVRAAVRGMRGHPMSRCMTRRHVAGSMIGRRVVMVSVCGNAARRLVFLVALAMPGMTAVCVCHRVVLLDCFNDG